MARGALHPRAMEIRVLENGLWVIVLEIFAAIGMAGFIIWWTWPRQAPGKGKNGQADNGDLK
jgi:hypothetical protein